MSDNRVMYSPFQVGNINVKNRLVKSAMFEYGADNGVISDRIIDMYKEAIDGGPGLIFSGMHSISDKGGNSPMMVQASHESYVGRLKLICDYAHEKDCRFFVQLQHTGPGTDHASGYDTFAASELEMAPGVIYHEASREELAKVAKDWGMAARRCKLAGADGVQIHAAHGFLMSTFLSPYFNERKDEYGGPIENRARLLFEVYNSIRNAVGNDYPVAMKISFNELVKESTTVDEMLWVIKTLQERGLDLVEISSGIAVDASAMSCVPIIKKGDREGNFLEYALMAAHELDIPVVSVCGYRTPEFIESVLKSSRIAAISFGRPLVCEPDLPLKWLTSNEPARCRSCNRCFEATDIIRCNFGRQRGSKDE